MLDKLMSRIRTHLVKMSNFLNNNIKKSKFSFFSFFKTIFKKIYKTDEKFGLIMRHFFCLTQDFMI